MQSQSAPDPPADFRQPVRRQLRDVGKALVLGVIGVHRDDLVVTLALVEHAHDTNGARSQEAHGDDGLLHEHQHINGIAVLAQRLGHEAVVVRVPASQQV
jgi:hypothetical protein